MTIIIDHERYGVKTSFVDIDEAERGFRSCGPDFAAVELRVVNDIVYDQTDEQVGYVDAGRVQVSLIEVSSMKEAKELYDQLQADEIGLANDR